MIISNHLMQLLGEKEIMLAYSIFQKSCVLYIPLTFRKFWVHIEVESHPVDYFFFRGRSLETKQKIKINRFLRVVGPICNVVSYIGLLFFLQIMWSILKSEEEYVEHLNTLVNQFQHPCEIATTSRHPPLTLETCKMIFRNWLVL